MFLWRIIYCLIFNQTPDAQYCYQAMSNLFILLSYKKRPQIIEINTIAITGLLVKKEQKDDNSYRSDWYHLSSFT
jgi:hypothetical protein